MTPREELHHDAVVAVPALLSASTVARLLDCSPWTVRRRIADGSLPAVLEHGRTMVRGDDLLAYVEGLERIGRPPGRRSPSPRSYEFLR